MSADVGCSTWFILQLPLQQRRMKFILFLLLHFSSKNVMGCSTSSPGNTGAAQNSTLPPPCVLILPTLREMLLPWQLSAHCQLSVTGGISIFSFLFSKHCSWCAAADVWRDSSESCARSQTSREHFPAGPNSKLWEPFFKAPENQESPTKLN